MFVIFQRALCSWLQVLDALGVCDKLIVINVVKEIVLDFLKSIRVSIWRDREKKRRKTANAAAISAQIRAGHPVCESSV